MSKGFIYVQGSGFEDVKDPPEPKKQKDIEPTPLQKQSPPEPKKEIKPRRVRFKPKKENNLTKEQEQEIIKQHQQDIEDSKKHCQESQKFKKDAGRKYATKTFASNGETMTMSGYGGPTAQKPPTGSTQVPYEDVKQRGDEIGHTFTNDGANDGGVPGRAKASHAEKQLSILSDKPIGVSKDMCKDCQDYFSLQAKASGKPLVVSDPTVTRIFMHEPPGKIIEVI